MASQTDSRIFRQKGSVMAFLTFISLLILSPGPSLAGTIVTDVANASTSEGVGSSSLIVYGGMAGQPSGTLDEQSVVDSCFYPTVAGLVACNNRRIHPSLQLRLAVKSDTIESGIPTVTNGDGSVDLTLLSSSTATVAKEEVAYIFLRWSTICSRMETENPSTIGSTTCLPVNEKAEVSLRVGISKDSNRKLNDAGDEYATVTFVVSKFIGQSDLNNPGSESLAKNCDQDDAVGICFFEMIPGDEKVVLKSNLRALGGFPNASPLPFKYLRVFFETDGSGGFAQISSASTYADLQISGSDIGSFNVTPNRIEGLKNDTFYYFKVAMVDAAGNVGYYTAPADDQYCQFSATNPVDCHIAQPGEVVGVLSENKCFVATAAFGSPMAPQVKTFRKFRDQFLLTSSWGSGLVQFYYQTSPPIAEWISQHEWARTTARWLLWPALGFASLSLATGSWVIVITTAIGLLLLLFTALLKPSQFTEHLNKRSFRSKKYIVLLIGFGLILGLATKGTAQPSSDDGFEEEWLSDGSAKDSSNELAAEPIPDESPPAPEFPYPDSPEEGFSQKVQAPPPPVPQHERPVHIDDEGNYYYDTSVSKPTPSQRPDVMQPKGTDSSGEFHYGTDLQTPSFSGRADIEAPIQIKKRGEFIYETEVSPRSGATSIRIGLMKPPKIKNPDNDVTFSQIYTNNDIPFLLVDYEFMLTERVGRLGLKLGSGAFARQGQGRFRNPTRASELPEERFTFLLFPNQISGIYKFQYAENQIIVPFVEGGAGYFTFTEIRDDGKKPKFGGAPVTVAAGGLNFLMDWLDRDSIRQLDLEYGINHVWLTLEYRVLAGLDSKLDFSSSAYNAGFIMEF